jgi:GNAT superfamily N-acetyltransferase
MQEIVSDFSAPTVARAIRANWADSYRYLGRSPSAELAVGPHLTWVLTGIPDSFLNVVLRTQLPPEGADQIIDQALTHFRDRQVTGLSWWAEPDTPSMDLGTRLTARGLSFSEGNTGMAADVTALREDAATPAGLTIVPVEDTAMLRQWSQLTSANFGIPEPGAQRVFDLYAGLGFGLPLRSYLALLGGRPVGTSQLFLGAGVAGIYHVTCLPEARQQGIGAALTLAALREARSLGYRIGILQASGMGSSVYRRLGFQAYGRMNSYLWENVT